MNDLPAALSLKTSGSRARVLLVEDNAINRKIAVFHLTSLDLEVDAVENGLHALEALNTGVYHLVLMDCLMPDMDGFEATQIIRQHWNDNVRNIPIIAVSANGTPVEMQRCSAVGMNDCLPKPLRLESVRAAISKWLPRP